MTKHQVRLVNMVPKSQSGETAQDSEPQITVNPENVRMMVGTAFTPPPGGGSSAPVYFSNDGGEKWTLNLIVPGAGGVTGDTDDQSIRFGGASTLYGGVLLGTTVALDILRSSPYSQTTVMPGLVSRTSIDQPYVSAIHSQGKDRVFIGNNDNSSGPFRGSVEHSSDARNAPAPAGFTQTVLDQRTPFIRELPPIRCAPHENGTVYVAYLSVKKTLTNSSLCDVVVARDDSFATGATPFTALIDTGDGVAGVRVAKSIAMPWTFPFTFLGNERIGASLSIAVDPRDHRKVYLAWGDGPNTGSTVTLRVRRSEDSGQTWSGDLVTVSNATNPALAITSDGKTGFLYQQLVGTRWETHVQITPDGWASPAEDILLANTPDDGSIKSFDPFIGDYADLQAVHGDFYGIFSADNFPDLANFPHGVRYQRNVDFNTKTLLNVNGTSPVKNSIDPFFVHIFWPREHEDVGALGLGRGRLEIAGLRYEMIEIEKLKIDLGDSPNDIRDETRRKDMLEVSIVLRHLAERIEKWLKHKHK